MSGKSIFMAISLALAVTAVGCGNNRATSGRPDLANDESGNTGAPLSGDNGANGGNTTYGGGGGSSSVNQIFGNYRVNATNSYTGQQTQYTMTLQAKPYENSGYTFMHMTLRSSNRTIEAYMGMFNRQGASGSYTSFLSQQVIIPELHPNALAIEFNYFNASNFSIVAKSCDFSNSCFSTLDNVRMTVSR